MNCHINKDGKKLSAFRWCYAKTCRRIGTVFFARTQLSRLGQRVIKHPNFRVKLSGTTETNNFMSCVNLSGSDFNLDFVIKLRKTGGNITTINNK